MGQFDFLVNGAQGINVPNPIALNQGALTVGNLANQYQGGQINLQLQRAMLAAMQDPGYSGAMGQLFGGALGSGGTPGAAQPGQADAVQSWFQRNPIGALQVMGQRAQLMTALSQVGKNNADAAQAEQSMRASIYQQWSGLGSSYGNTKGGALTDSQKNMFWSLSQRAAGVGAIPQQFLPEIYQHLTSDQDGGKAFLGQLGVAGVNYAEQATGGLAAAKTPGTPGLIGAQTAEATAKAGSTPLEAAASAATAASRGATVETSPVTGQPMIVRKSPGPEAYLSGAGGGGGSATVPVSVPFAPQNPQEAAALAAVRAAGPAPAAFEATQGAPTDITQSLAPGGAYGPAAAAASAPTTGGVGSATPVTGPNGQPVQTALTPPQAEQKTALGKQLDQVNAGTLEAQRVQQLLPLARSFLQSGYTGTFAGSETGKALLNALSSAGLLSTAAAQKLANMRASDAVVTELLAPMARMLSSRGSNMAMKVASNAKPGTENSLPVALQMINALGIDAANQVRYGKAFNAYTAANPSDLGMVGFQPPTPVTFAAGALAGGSRVDQLPPTAPLGSRAVGDDGSVLIFNGKSWLPAGR